jgi:hypothetical protein
MKSRAPEIAEGPVSADAFTPEAIESDVSWLPDLIDCEERPETTEIFVLAYLADPGAWHWSTDLVNDSREKVLKRALAIIAEARLPDHQPALGQLGAGPLEDLMSDTLLDDLRAWMPFGDAMRYTLNCVRMNVEPPALERRLKGMLSARQSHRGRT